MSGQSGTNTTTTQSGPPPQVLQAYQNLTGAATNLASTNPLQFYNGPMVAGFTPQQQTGFADIANADGIATPYINAAGQEFGTATTPLWAQEPQYGTSTVNQYLSPYTQDVTQSLTDLYNNQNATTAQQIAGNATSAGAYGGDREAVAQALATQQENLSQAPTLAQVEQQGFTGAQGEFNTEQQQELSANEANSWLASQAGFGLGSLGQEAQTTALTGANAELTAGAQQQQLGQEQLNIPEEEFQAEQAYPYQELGFLSPIVEGTGSLSGGTGTTTSPGPSTLGEVAGLGLAGTGVLGATGAFGSNGYLSNLFGSGASTAGDLDFGGTASRGGNVSPHGSMKNSGTIESHPHHAGGGMVSMPLLPSGIGSGVPNITLNYIPQGSGMGSSSPLGLSPFQADTSVTNTQSSASNPLSDILGAAGIVKLGASILMKSGGRADYDSGGTATTNNTPGSMGASKIISPLPTVPKIDIDYIVAPGPVAKGGSTIPKPPNPIEPDNPVRDVTTAAGQMNSMKGLFGGQQGSATTPTETTEAKHGGRMGFDAGGATASDVPLNAAVQFGGASPNVQGAYQQLLQLPLNRLQEMAVQFPPTTQQGQLIAQAVKMKMATPGSGTASTMGAAQGAPIGSAQAPTGAPQAGGTAQVASNPQQFGGTAMAMADGGDTGDAGFVTEDELDPHPVVDHSGDTVKIRYPSEGKVLDLGIPSFKGRQHYAAGGSSSGSSLEKSTNSLPQISYANGQWTVNGATGGGNPTPATPITGPANNAQLGGTGSGTSLTSLPTANGVAVPQINTNTFGSSNPLMSNGSFTGGSGLGNYFQPLSQYQPPGTSTANNMLSFPALGGYTPGMAGLYNTYNSGSLPAQFGGSPQSNNGGSSSNSSGSSTPTMTTAQLIAAGDSGEANVNAPVGSVDWQLAQQQIEYGSSQNSGSGGGGKRGGNTRHFADGGNTDDPMEYIEPPPSKEPQPTAPPRLKEMKYGSGIGTAKAPAVDLQQKGLRGFDDGGDTSDDAGAGFAANISGVGATQIPTGDAGDLQTALDVIAHDPNASEPTRAPLPGGQSGEVKSGNGPTEIPAGEAPAAATPLPPPKAPATTTKYGIGIGSATPVSDHDADLSESEDFRRSTDPLHNNLDLYLPKGGIGDTGTAPTSASVEPTKGGIGDDVYGVGDSHAGGLIHGGLKGSMGKDPSILNADAANGRTPKQVYDFITSRPDGYWQGKKVSLSSGASNDPNSAADWLPWQVDALKSRGANVVDVAGFGPRGAGGVDMHPIADQMAPKAAAAGLPFGGVWENNLQPDQTHLTPAGYKQVADWERSAAGASPTAKSPDTVEPPGAQNVRSAITALRSAGASDAFVQAALNQPYYEGGWKDQWQAGDPDKGGSYGHLQFNAQPGSELPRYQEWLAKNNPQGLNQHDTGLQFSFLASRVPENILHSNDPKAITDYLDTNFENYRGAAAGQRYGHLDDAAKLMAGDYSSLNNVGSATDTGGGGFGHGRMFSDAPPNMGGGPGGMGTEPTSYSSGMGTNARMDTYRPQTAQERFQQMWPMLAISTGAGMLASRSKFPGVALGEGLKTGLGEYNQIAGQDTKEQLAQAQNQRITDTRNNQQAVNEARLDAIQQRADAATQRSQDASQRLAESIAHNQADEGLRAAAIAAQQESREAQLQVATAKVQLGEYGTPVYMEHDPNDPSKPGGMYFPPKVPDASKPLGGGQFVAGVGAPKAATGEQAILHELVSSGAAKDEADALRVLTQLKSNPNAQPDAVAKMVGSEVANLRSLPTNINASQATLEAQARKNVYGRLGLPVPGAPAQPAASPAPAAAPQQQQPATSNIPTGATGQRKNADGSTTYWVPGKGEVTVGAPAQ